MEEIRRTDNEIAREFDERVAQEKGVTKFRTNSIMVTTTVSNQFWNLAKEHNVSWAEAMRVGISMILAEKGLTQYDNKLSIWRKMNLFRAKAEESLQKVEELTTKLTEREGIVIEKSK